MRWPWQREERSAGADAPAPISPAGWAFLPPLQRQMMDAAPATLRPSFESLLPTRAVPSSLGTMGHLVDGAAPAGVIGVGDAEPSAPVQRAVASELSLRHPPSASPPRVQRAVAVAEPPPAAPVAGQSESTPPGDSNVPAESPADTEEVAPVLGDTSEPLGATSDALGAASDSTVRDAKPAAPDALPAAHAQRVEAAPTLAAEPEVDVATRSDPQIATDTGPARDADPAPTTSAGITGGSENALVGDPVRSLAAPAASAPGPAAPTPAVQRRVGLGAPLAPQPATRALTQAAAQRQTDVVPTSTAEPAPDLEATPATGAVEHAEPDLPAAVPPAEAASTPIPDAVGDRPADPLDAAPPRPVLERSLPERSLPVQSLTLRSAPPAPPVRSVPLVAARTIVPSIVAPGLGPAHEPRGGLARVVVARAVAPDADAGMPAAERAASSRQEGSRPVERAAALRSHDQVPAPATVSRVPAATTAAPAGAVPMGGDIRMQRAAASISLPTEPRAHAAMTTRAAVPVQRAFGLPSLPTTPKLPSAPSMPTLPSRPDLPSIPDRPDIPSADELRERGADALPELAEQVPGAADAMRSASNALTQAGQAVAPGGSTSSGPENVEQLVRKLYVPLVRRLKAELLLDRERRGIRIDGI
jgi:hypothetical protein